MRPSSWVLTETLMCSVLSVSKAWHFMTFTCDRHLSNIFILLKRVSYDFISCLEFADVEKVIETAPKSYIAQSRIPAKPFKKNRIKPLANKIYFHELDIVSCCCCITLLAVLFLVLSRNVTTFSEFMLRKLPRAIRKKNDSRYILWKHAILLIKYINLVVRLFIFPWQNTD